MVTKRQYLQDEAVGMIADLETKLRNMTPDELELVTARLTDLRLELKEKKVSVKNETV